MRGKLRGQIDRCRAVCTTDDGDRGSLRSCKSDNGSHDECEGNTELSAGAHEEGRRSGDQGSKVSHRTNSHEDQAREDTQLNA